MKTESKLLLMAGASLLSACASGPSKPPVTPLQSATVAVARADEARVGDYAYEDMRHAREHLSAAREANARAQQGKDPAASISARQFADEATVDAELATAKAQQARVQAAMFALQQQLGLVPQAAPEAPLPDADTLPPVDLPAPDMPAPDIPPPADAPLQPLSPDHGAAS